MAKDNKSLGQFNLGGILPAARGVPQVEVTFDVDVNGILKVSAKDKATGKENSIRIEGSNNLSDDEINRMKAEAEKYAEADKKEREVADTINKGDSIIFSQEKMLEEQKDNITSDEKSSLEDLINQMKEAVKDKNVNKINELETTINSKWNEISSRIYGQQQNNTEQPQ
jgi:molecular chaperone DnaK